MSDPKVHGGPVPTAKSVLETVAGLTQDFAPTKNICAYINAFHIYADDPSRKVETNHYCAHISEDVRQCLLYGSANKNARIIGIEYMITPTLYHNLPSSERKLWYSHAFEVKSGQLIMPRPTGVLESVWEAAETKEMEPVVQLYGKTYYLWQVDRGDKLPKLMVSLTEESLEIQRLVEERDARLVPIIGGRRS